MGVSDSDQVNLTITKRAAATSTAECTSPYTYEKVFCKNGWAALGCFTADPCTDDGGATSSEWHTSFIIKQAIGVLFCKRVSLKLTTLSSCH